MPPDPKYAHRELTPEQWQQYLQRALAAHRQNPQDSEAMQAVQQANHALNAYDTEAVNPQATAQDEVLSGFKALGSGALNEAKGIPAGIEQLITDVSEGHPIEAAKHVGQGFMQMGKHVLTVPKMAMEGLDHALNPEKGPISINETLAQLHDVGAGGTDIGLLMAPKLIGKGVGALKESVNRGATGTEITPTSSGLQPKPITDPGSVTRTMTPEQMDPYGLNQPGTVPKPQQSSGFNPNDPLHDILTPEQAGQGPKPLTPKDIEDLLNSLVDEGKSSEPIIMPYHDMLKPGELEDGPVPLKPSDINNILNGPTAKTPPTPKRSALPPQEPVQPDINFHFPSGKINALRTLAKLLSTRPDATAVRTKALQGALKASTFSGMAPDSTKKK